MTAVHGRTHELLAPAGNWDCARAAVAAGADAIYFGLSRFNARMRADNFTEDDLGELMAYLHRHGLKGLVTMNTLIFTAELESAAKQLITLAEAGVDAVIVQDLGLAKLAAELTPDLALHASTQMTITSPEALACVESLVPLKRAILARELSIADIARFPATETSTPLEVFVHGALCVAYSGQCLTSESLGQRSANRGECAQACRMPYQLVVDGVTRDLGDQRYLLSPQDLAAVDLLPDLVRAGVTSFKIEGRLKSPEYVTAVTRVYRKALNAALAEQASPVTAADRYALEMTFSRGLSTGWLAGTNHPYLTHGRFGKKRGPLLGTITACGPGWIRLARSNDIPLAAGDGVVFDAGEIRDFEQGGRVWKTDGEQLWFHRAHSHINFARVQAGQTVYKTSDPRLESELKRSRHQAPRREHKTPLHITAGGRPGEPLVLTARCGAPGDDSGIDVSIASSAPLAAAATRPLDTTTLHAQLGRLGGTPYQLASLENRLTGDCHLPLATLNHLRRALVDKLTHAIGRSGAVVARKDLADCLPPRDAEPLDTSGPAMSVMCRGMAQVAAAIDCGVAMVYCDFEDPRRYKDAVAMVRAAAANTKIVLATPRILKPGETGLLKSIDACLPDGVLLRNLAAVSYYKDRTDWIRAGDFSLNVANPVTARLLMEDLQLSYLTVSYDLNIGQVLALLRAAPTRWFELTLHQHMPMFHMEHCVFCAFLSKGTDYTNCGRPCDRHELKLRDRVGAEHPVKADAGCRNTVYNAAAQTGAEHVRRFLACGARRFRVEFLNESAEQMTRTVKRYRELLAGKCEGSALWRELKLINYLGVTRGPMG